MQQFASKIADLFQRSTSEDTEQQTKIKLVKILNLSARKIPYYKPYKNIPFILWPIIDEQQLRDQEIQFRSKKWLRKTQQPFNLYAYSSAEINYFLALSAKRRRNHYRDKIMGYVCHHGHICFPKSLYYIEPSWADDAHVRYMPIVTTLTRIESVMVRLRLNQVFTYASCVCSQHAWTITKQTSTADEILYLPHLFDKRSLPIYKDELQTFFRQFSSIQISEIMQQSLHQWRITMCCLQTQLSHSEYLIENALQQFLSAKQVKCPNIQWIIHPNRRSNGLFKIVKNYSCDV